MLPKKHFHKWFQPNHKLALWPPTPHLIAISLMLVLMILTLSIPGSSRACVPATPSLTVQPSIYQWAQLPEHCKPFLKANEYQTPRKQHLITVTLKQQGLTNGCFQLQPVAVDTLSSIQSLYNQHKPLAAINAGFFDPSNQQTVSYIQLTNGTILDPKANSHLTNNPGLAPYLSAVFNRSELRQYQCGTLPAIRHAITPRNAPVPSQCTLQFAIGGGPQVLPEFTATTEAFYTQDAQSKKIVRDPVRIHAKLARSAVAITPSGDIILAMGRNTPSTPGWSLKEMGTALTELGATQVIALDGGSSSGMSIGNHVVYGNINKDNTPLVRRLKSFIWIMPHHE